MNDDKYLAEQGKALAKDVLNLNKVCDKSKMQDIELEQLKKIVDLARNMCAGEYVPSDDQVMMK